MSELNIPLGARAVAQATENVRVVGNLNAAGDLPGGGSVITLTPTSLTGFRIMSGASNPPDGDNMIDTDSLLVEIEDPLSAGQAMFSEGQRLQINGARKGGATLPVAEFTIAATSTIDDLMKFFNEALGLHETGTANPDGRTPGAIAISLTGSLAVFGNVGTINDLDLPSDAFRLLNADGSIDRLPFVSN